jgi:hypothetical protein
MIYTHVMSRGGSSWSHLLQPTGLGGSAPGSARIRRVNDFAENAGLVDAAVGCKAGIRERSS